jgi:hypothetical protein
MRQILPYSLWIGHAGDRSDFRRLHDHDIRAVIDLAWDEPPVVAPRDFVCCRFPLVDGSGNPPWLLRTAVECAVHLLRSEVPLLICCSYGGSRSPAVSALALSLVREESPEACLALIGQTGHCDVSPELWEELRALFAVG